MSLNKNTKSKQNINDKLPTFLISKQNNYDIKSNITIDNKIEEKIKTHNVKSNNNNSKKNDDINDIVVNCNETHETIPDNVFNYFCNLENNKKNISGKNINDNKKNISGKNISGKNISGKTINDNDKNYNDKNDNDKNDNDKNSSKTNSDKTNSDKTNSKKKITRKTSRNTAKRTRRSK